MRGSGLVFLVALGSGCNRRDPSRELTPTPSQDPVPAAASGSSTTEVLRDGDLIFQESTSRQSEMVRALTGSRWTHMGVVFLQSSRPVVLEAVSPVRRTPLHEWVARGVGHRYVVKRLRDADRRLGPEVITAMRTLGDRWLGRPYDLQFRWDDESMYCSELAYKLFDRAAHVRLGRLERARDMNLDDERVKRALDTRYASRKFDPDEPVVTPGTIFEDEQFEAILER